MSSETAPAFFPKALELTEVSAEKKPWTLTLHAEHLALADARDAQPYIILRGQMAQAVSLLEGGRIFALHKPLKQTFTMTREGMSALVEWIGDSVLAASYLKKRYAWVLPLAILWILSSLPLPGVVFDAIGFGLGITLLMAWSVAKWRPHPMLFLVDSIWFAIFAAQTVIQVMNGRSKFWLIFVALSLWMVITGLKHFTRFRRTRIR